MFSFFFFFQSDKDAKKIVRVYAGTPMFKLPEPNEAEAGAGAGGLEAVRLRLRGLRG
jgi:hypothetical protein